MSFNAFHYFLLVFFAANNLKHCNERNAMLNLMIHAADLTTVDCE